MTPASLPSRSCWPKRHLTPSSVPTTCSPSPRSTCCRQRGVSVPGDVAVVGMDDTDICRVGRPDADERRPRLAPSRRRRRRAAPRPPRRRRELPGPPRHRRARHSRSASRRSVRQHERLDERHRRAHSGRNGRTTIATVGATWSGGRSGRDAWKLVLPACCRSCCSACIRCSAASSSASPTPRPARNDDGRLHRPPELPRAAATTTVLGVVPHRPRLDPVGDDPAVLRSPSASPCCSTSISGCAGSPARSPSCPGRSPGDRGDHVAADAASSLGRGQQGPPRARVRR